VRRSFTRHEDAHLRSSSYGFRHEEGCRESWLPKGQTRQQARGPSLLLLSESFGVYQICAYEHGRL